MISIVCVYNNERILNDYLVKSLDKQTVKFELIKLNNTKGYYKSASQALNSGGKKTKGKYIMFVHQDVDLFSKTWLEEVEKMLDNMSNLGIVGVAGKKNKNGVMTNITHGEPPKLAGKICIQKPVKVQTLDECLIIIPRCVFDVLQFDEKVCDDWHLYAVDYCLNVRRLGFDAYVIPKRIYHRSPGYSMSKRYYVILKKVVKKHKQDYKIIYTTMGNWNTSTPLILQIICTKLKCILKYLSEIPIAKN